MVVDSAYNHSKFSNMEETKPKRISTEDIEKFIDGHDPQRKIVNLLYRYRDDFITVVYRDENDIKRQRKENFYPFCWAKLSACRKLCGGDRQELIKLMNRFKIGVKKLSQTNVNGEVRHEFDDGYLFLFYAKSPMSYSDFLYFFKKAGNPIYSDKKKEEEDPLAKRNSGNKQYLCVTPQEQFMISTGKRFFKGYDDYDEVLKMTFDLETTGLDTDKDEIEQIGIRINRPFPGHPNGFERIFTNLGRTKEERGEWELWMIEQMLKIIYTFKPDVITAHNGENFDWNMIIGACNRLGVSFEELSAKYFNGEGIKKSNKPSSLKLGGEREDYYETIVPGVIITDSLHAVRRAQALDSNMLKADLKYVTEYSKMKKPNRVYIPGKEISNTWADKDYQYALNDENGDWYRYDPEMEDDETKFEPIYGKKDFIPVHGFVKDGYVLKSGRYIAERYLFDDLWECDKVEHRYNTPNFLICKMLPVPYKKCTTMGTAGQWKALMLAWSYEQGIAVPSFGDKAKFTGGLSRLLRTGYVKNVIKLDYNSLYPSIILTWGISDPTDLMQAMLNFLEHVLTQREKYKGLKKIAGKKKNSATTDEEKRKYAAEESANDKKQLPLKILGNSFFGSYGAPDVFPWGSLKCAEQTTCTGRQALRLMISHFKQLGYEPIVGDSFTEDTPVFIRYTKTGEIDIKPVCELMDESKTEIDALGREYDYSAKDFQILCRSGWVSPSYIYRHKTNKDIYEVSDNGMSVEVTGDHSLFDSNREKIKPSEINESTTLEYFSNDKVFGGRKKVHKIDSTIVEFYAKELAKGAINSVPMEVLNRPSCAERFYKTFMENYRDDIKYSKVCLAGLQYLKRSIS